MKGVSLWLIEHVDPTAFSGSALLDLLSEPERVRFQAMGDQGRRNQYLVAHAALRTLLARELELAPKEVNFVIEPGGRPRLHEEHGTQLQFSISHTAGMIALALHHGGPVGVDVESIQRKSDAGALAARFFHPKEQVYVQSASSDSERLLRLLRCWTMKEAWFKALGGSTSSVLRELCFVFDTATPWVQPIGALNNLGEVGPRLWSAQPSSEHTLALVWQPVEAPFAKTVRCFSLDSSDLSEVSLALVPNHTGPQVDGSIHGEEF